MVRGKKSRSAAALGLGRLADVLFPLMRAYVLTQLLPQEQFGLAITLSVMAALVELSTDIGLDRYAVVSNDQSDLARGTMHSLSIMRGALIGLLLAVAGPFAAHIFDAPQAWWAFSLLGLGSLIRGFMNLGIKEAQRDFRFGPEALTLGLTQATWTLLSILLAWLLQDYRCMLFGILGAQIMFVLVSHITSHMRWQVRWSPDHARAILRFSLPLVPNGINLAFRNMVDRLIVGAYLGLKATAVYNINMMVATLPSNIIQTYIASLMLPIFVRHENGEQRMPRLYMAWPIALAAIATIYGAGVMCFAQPVVALVFGAHFAIDQFFLTMVGAIVTIKIICGLPVPPSLAVGDTKFVLFASATGLGAPLLGFIAANIAPSLKIFIIGMCAGELLGLLIVAWRCQHRYGFKPASVWIAVFAPLVMVVALGLVLGEFAPELLMRILIFCIASAIAGAIFAYALARSGIPLRTLLKRKRAAAPPLPQGDAEGV